MPEKILISVTDYREVNFHAFQLMLDSCRRTGNHLFFDRLAVLHPRDKFPDAFIAYLRENAVEAHGFDVNLSEDTYRIKLLLADFIAARSDEARFIFYLDPDHVFLKDLNLEDFPLAPDTLYVSSEVTSFHEAQHLCPKFRCHRFFNTSIIFGAVETWSSILLPWRDTYAAISPFVPSRHREEIAFSIAGELSKVKIQPVHPSFQANFSLFEKQCRMFHYGGESEHTSQVKALLGNGGRHRQQGTHGPDTSESRWLKQIIQLNRPEQKG